MDTAPPLPGTRGPILDCPPLTRASLPEPLFAQSCLSESEALALLRVGAFAVIKGIPKLF